MKQYPSIVGPDRGFTELPCLAFNKLDGSNMRFEWSPKQGWYKYGTRTQMIDDHNPEYGEGIRIFRKKYVEGIEKVIRNKYGNVQSVIAYAEFLGPHSFAGQHDVPRLRSLGFDIDNNEPKDLILFDINIHKRGFVPPREFVALFGHLHVPEVVYEGMLTEKFVADVREGMYPLKEGVIVKGGAGHNLWMMKVKTNSYKEELKKRYAEKWEQYWE